MANRTMSCVLLASLLRCLAHTGVATAQTANSVADFSGVQGQGGWTYGFYEGPSLPSAFQQLPFFDGTKWHREQGTGGYHTRLDAHGGHPNGLITTGGAVPIDNWAVRRWTPAGSSRFAIEGEVRVSEPGGNGVIARIIAGNNEVWTQTVTHNAPRTFAIVVQADSTIDFAIDANGNDLHDGTAFEVVISDVGACRPDITGTAIAGSPGYLVPDGILNNDDFFAYLAEFAAGNLAVCNMPCNLPFPACHPPVCNSDDFFYYLAMFAAGC